MKLSKKGKRNLKISLVIAAIVALIIFLLTDLGRELFLIFQFNGEALRRYIKGKGALGPWIFFALSYLQVVIAPIPGQLIHFMGGLLFGVWKGFFINHLATVLGSLTAYMLGKAFGEPLTEKLAGRKNTKKVVEFVKRNGAVFFLLAFVLPGLPDDLLCYVAGIVNLPFRVFLILALVARIPFTLTVSLLGDGLLKWTTEQTVFLVVFSVVFTVLVIIFRKPITNFLNKIARIDSQDQDVDISDIM